MCAGFVTARRRAMAHKPCTMRAWRAQKKNVTPRSTHLADDQHGQHSQRCGAGHWGAFAGTGEWGEGGQRGEERGGARFSHKKSE